MYPQVPVVPLEPLEVLVRICFLDTNTNTIKRKTCCFLMSLHYLHKTDVSLIDIQVFPTSPSLTLGPSGEKGGKLTQSDIEMLFLTSQ